MSTPPPFARANISDMPVNHLPEDAPPGSTSTAWFGRYSPFIQAETRRQVAYRRRAWPDIPNGTSRTRKGTYPHILPAERWELNLYEPIRAPVVAYLAEHDIALHAEAANLRSSQVCCFNFLFPLRQDLDAAARVLGAVLDDVEKVESIEFEDAGEPGATEWLGEPVGGKRGQNRTSIDAAVRWTDRAGRRRLTLIEWKYTEESFGGCGGYASKGNLDPARCESLDVRNAPASRCYLAGPGRHTGRRYWEHLRPEIIERLAGLPGCPFRGPLYQLLRQELLAEHFRATGRYEVVDVVALHFEANDALRTVPPYLRGRGPTVGAIWAGAVGDGFREVPIERVLERYDQAPVLRLEGWRGYLRERYGV